MELPRGREKKFNKRNTWFGICYLILQEDIDEATAAVLKLLIFAEFLLESHFICKFSKALPTKLMYSKPYDPNALNTTRYHRLLENVTFGKYQTWRVVDTRPDYALFLCFICCPVVRLASSHLNTIYFYSHWLLSSAAIYPETGGTVTAWVIACSKDSLLPRKEMQILRGSE